MQKTKIGILVGVFLLLTLGIVVAQTETMQEARYLVKSNNMALKAMFGVQHNFDNGFTTELTQGRVKALEMLGVKVEKVELYQILAKPPCNNDGICDPEENPSCADCKSGDDEEPAPEERTCYPNVQEPWGITKVNGGSGGAEINVAVLDTGVYTDHLDLNVKLCKDTTKRGVRNGCSDNNGHGTHVSGTIAANGGSDSLGIFGVAPEANLWVVKVCGPSGCWTDDIAEAIRYVADKGANIISMSLGGDTQSMLIKDAIDYAVGKGVLVVAAAGNDGPEDGSIDYPGANAKVIAVGAIDSSEVIASWSSRGIYVSPDEVISEREVEFGAPGVSIESTYNNGCYAVGEGTSMATPHVAGLAAKLWQGNAIDTRTYLQGLAKLHDLHTKVGYDTATGFGLPIAP